MTKSKSPEANNIEGNLTTISASFSGPLPPPNILEGYEKIQTGTADRIIAMAEKQLAHRHSMEQSLIQSNIKNEKIGIIFAFILTLALMIFGTYLVFNNKETIGYFAVFSPVIFHAANYIYNKNRETKLMEENITVE